MPVPFYFSQQIWLEYSGSLVRLLEYRDVQCENAAIYLLYRVPTLFQRRENQAKEKSGDAPGNPRSETAKSPPQTTPGNAEARRGRGFGDW